LSFSATQADPAAVERLLREAGVDREIAPVSWSQYFESLVEALLERLFGDNSPLHDFLQQHTGIPRWITYALLATVVLIALAIVVEIVRRRARGVSPAGEGRHVSSRPLPAARDAAAWRAELERRLAGGERGPALEALWWWFALSVAAEVPESCTSRELVARAGRPELVSPARELDRLLYGPQRPQAPELRAMVRHLEQVLS
jgi:hypothetical protein